MNIEDAKKVIRQADVLRAHMANIESIDHLLWLTKSDYYAISGVTLEVSTISRGNERKQISHALSDGLLVALLTELKQRYEADLEALR